MTPPPTRFRSELCGSSDRPGDDRLGSDRNNRVPPIYGDDAEHHNPRAGTFKASSQCNNGERGTHAHVLIPSAEIHIETTANVLLEKTKLEDLIPPK